MEQDMKNIDDLFKEELGGYTEAPPPPVWQALERRLDNDRKRRVFPFRWFWYISLISFVVLLGASLAWRTTKETQPVAVVVTDAGSMMSSKLQDATPAKKTPANAAPVTNVHHKKNVRHKYNKTQKDINNTTVVKNNTKKERIVSEQITAPTEPKIQARSRQQDNYNSSTSGLYAYEEDEPQSVSNIENAEQEPEVHEQATGYTVNRTRKHNLVAADMSPIVGEEKPVAYKRAVTEEPDEQKQDIADDNSGIAVASRDRNETSFAPPKPKVKHVAAKVTPAAVINPHTHKLIFASKPGLHNATDAIAALKKGSYKKYPTGKNSNHTKKIAASPKAVNLKTGAAVAVIVNKKASPKQDIATSKKTSPKPNQEPVSSNLRVAKQDREGNSQTHKEQSNKIDAVVTTPGVSISGATTQKRNPVTQIPGRKELQPTAIASAHKTTPPQKKITGEILASTPAPIKAKKTKAPAVIPVPDKTKTAYAAEKQLSAQKTKQGRKNHTKTVSASASTDNVKEAKQQLTKRDKEQKNHNTKAVSGSVSTNVNETTQQLTKKSPKQKKDNAKSVAKKLTSDNSNLAPKELSKKTQEKKIAAKKQTAKPERKSNANVYAAAQSNPVDPQASTKSNGNRPLSSRPNFNSSVAGIEEPSIIDIVPHADREAKSEAAASPEPISKQPSVASPAASEGNDSASVLSRFVYGIKGGFEGGFSSGGAYKGVISPYLEYKLNAKFSLMTQPAFKVSHINARAVGNANTYFDTSNSTSSYTLISSSTLHIIGGPDLTMREYAYKETHDSIVKSYGLGGTYVEAELPLLLKYSITRKLSVYGGVNMCYSKFIKIKENTTRTMVDFSKPVTTLGGLTQPAPDPSTQLGSVTFAGTSIANYSGPVYPTEQGNSFRMGYMLGFSYEIKKRWMIDAVMQQAKAKSNIQGGYDVNTPLSLPYFRFTLGYELSK